MEIANAFALIQRVSPLRFLVLRGVSSACTCNSPSSAQKQRKRWQRNSLTRPHPRSARNQNLQHIRFFSEKRKITY